MRVLHLTHSLPWPADSEDRISTLNQMRADSHVAEVSLLSFVDTPAAPQDIGALETICTVVETVRRCRTLDGEVRGARSFLSSSAMKQARYHWPGFSSALRRFLTRWNPDVVVAHHLAMGNYLLEARNAVTVFRTSGLESELLYRYAGTLRSQNLAGAAARQAEMVHQAELRLAPRVDYWVVPTVAEEKAVQKLDSRARTLLAPPAIDPSAYAEVSLPSNPSDLLAVAVADLSHRPAGEGILWFAEQVWPMVLRSQPRGCFRIIGRCPERLYDRLNRCTGVEVMGEVDDVVSHVHGAHAAVVPLKITSGIPLRVIEAMAWRLPVLTTSPVNEGIQGEPGRHLLLADTPDAAAQSLLHLHKDTRLNHSLRREGRRLVEKRYTLDVLDRTTGKLYRQIAQQGPAALKAA